MRLAPLIRPLVELHWTQMVATLNHVATEEQDLHRHLFGRDRLALSRTLRVTETRLCSKQEWNAFAESCNATYLCSYGHVMSERLQRRVRVFAAYVDDTKIAQCAILLDGFVAAPMDDF